MNTFAKFRSTSIWGDQLPGRGAGRGAAAQQLQDPAPDARLQPGRRRFKLDKILNGAVNIIIILLIYISIKTLMLLFTMNKR